MKAPLLRAALLAALAAAAARAQDADAAPLTVLFALAAGRTLVRGSANGVPLTFLLDTASAATLLTPAAAEKARLARGVASSLGAGKALAQDLPVATADLPRADYDGVLGTTYLSRFVLTIDYKTR